MLPLNLRNRNQGRSAAYKISGGRHPISRVLRIDYSDFLSRDTIQPSIIMIKLC